MGDCPRCLDYPRLDVGPITTGSVQEEATLLGTREGLLFVWDNKTTRMRRHWAAQRSTREVSDLDLSGKHHRAISVGDDMARLWNVDSGRPVGSPLRVAGGPIAVRLSDDGGLALIGDETGEVRLWKLPELKPPWGSSPGIRPGRRPHVSAQKVRAGGRRHRSCARTDSLVAG